MNSSERNNPEKRRRITVVGTHSDLSTAIAKVIAENMSIGVSSTEIQSELPRNENYDKGITTEKEKDIIKAYRNMLINDRIGIYPKEKNESK